MNDKTWLIIYMIIGWVTSIVVEIQCQSWKRKHGEAITAWIIESNNKDKQIYKLQEELENLKAKPVKHGKWELTDNPSFRKCSECGAWWSSDITDNYFTNYCPRCGKGMIK